MLIYVEIPTKITTNDVFKTLKTTKLVQLFFLFTGSELYNIFSLNYFKGVDLNFTS